MQGLHAGVDQSLRDFDLVVRRSDFPFALLDDLNGHLELSNRVEPNFTFWHLKLLFQWAT